VALRLLHFADLHLDRSFASEGLAGAAAQERRSDLRRALERIVGRAREENCDAITCGGDLFEHARVTKETALFVSETLGSAGRPVLIAPGDADPPLPSSPYRYLRWPDNVRIAMDGQLRSERIGDALVWFAASGLHDEIEPPLQGFTAAKGSVNLLLLHASDVSSPPPSVKAWAPISASQVQQAGFAHALLGHYHRAQTGPRITYPGSPEPMGWHEGGRHCVALVTVSEGSVKVGLEDFNQSRFAQETIDITGMASADDVGRAIAALRVEKSLEGALLRLRLIGERPPSLAFDSSAVPASWSDRLAHLEIRDDTIVSQDLSTISREFTSRGELVRRLSASAVSGGQTPQAVARALRLALNAFQD
jgi:exonuclease SbcD